MVKLTLDDNFQRAHPDIIFFHLQSICVCDKRVILKITLASVFISLFNNKEKGKLSK